MSKARMQHEMLGVVGGGFAYGLLEKSFPQIPTIPILGKSGTIALAIYFFGPKKGIIRDAGIAAAAIAGYSLGREGQVSGTGLYDDDHGLAAET